MTSVVKGIFGSGVLGLAGKLLFGGGKKKPAQELPEATRDVAEQQQAVDDELRRRKGSAADILNGVRGVEAAANQTGKLVVGN